MLLTTYQINSTEKVIHYKLLFSHISRNSHNCMCQDDAEGILTRLLTV